MANNRVAYGLAKEQGIDTKDMSPKEVWEALAKKGITEKSVSEKGLQDKSIGEAKSSSVKSTYKIDFNNYDEDIDWDTAEKNEKINGNKGKNEKRKDKYGNPLVSDEAFNVGVDAVKGYLDYMSKDGLDHKKLKASNIYADALQNVISKAITEAGYNPASDITETDFNEIIGTATGEEYKTELDRTGSGEKRWTGKAYTGYNPEMKAGFDKFYKKAVDTFVETKKRQPTKDELNALRQTAQITTALSLLSQKYNT